MGKSWTKLARSSCPLGENLKASPGRTRYIRLETLLKAGGTLVLREFLEHIIAPANLETVLNRSDVHAKLTKLKKKGVLKDDQWELLFPPAPGCVQSTFFDITLLVILLRQKIICNLTPPSTGWDNLPNITDVSLAADIARIKFYRNNIIAHINEKMTLRNEEFDDYWTQVKESLLRIVGFYAPSGSSTVNEYENAIDHLRTGPLVTAEDSGSGSKSDVQEKPPGVFTLRCILKLARYGAWLGGTLYVLNWINNNPDLLADFVHNIVPGISVKSINFGSIMLQLHAEGLNAMDELRKRYDTGELKAKLERFMITEELKGLADGESIEFTVEIDEEEYITARQYLDKKKQEREQEMTAQQETTKDTPCKTEQEKEKEMTVQQETTKDTSCKTEQENEQEMTVQQETTKDTPCKTEQQNEQEMTVQETAKDTPCKTEQEKEEEMTVQQETTKDTPCKSEEEKEEEMTVQQETTKDTPCKTEQEKEMEYKQQLEQEKKRNEEPQPFCVLPPKPSHEVIYRTDEITKILLEMEKLRNTRINEITVVYLSGNSGCGKSEIARQIGEKVYNDILVKENEVKFVFTLNASSRYTLIQSYIEFANRLRCDEIVITDIAASKDLSQDEKLIHLKKVITPKLKKYFSWLLIVDNVIDVKFVSRYIPKAREKTESKGQLLITTQDSRSIALDSYTYCASLSLGMGCDDAIRALNEISEISADKRIILRVAEALDFQPLALACAATYMRSIRSKGSSISWEKYMEKLGEGKREATERDYKRISLAYPQTMTVPFKMALENEVKESEIMAHSFEFLSLLAPEPVPLEYIVQYVTSCCEYEDHLVAAEISFSSLLLLNEFNVIHMHKVVYICLQSIRDEERLLKPDVFKGIKAFSTLLDSFDIENTESLILAQTKPIVSHFSVLVRALNQLSTTIEKRKYISVIESLSKIGKICFVHGEYATSQICFRICLTVETSAFGENDSALIVTLNNLANIYVVLGNYGEAKLCLERALAIEESKQSNSTATLSNLANVLSELGHYEKAKHYLKRALAIEYTTKKKNFSSLAHLINNLGNVYIHLGKHEKAKTYLEKALAIQEMVYDQSHPYLASTLSNLGNVLRDHGKYEEAKRFFERALAIQEMAYDESHPQLAPTLSNLGLSLRDVGQAKEAKEYFERALAIQEMAYGENHPQLAPTLSNLGLSLRDLGQPKKGKQHFERALAIQEMAYDENHPQLATTLSSPENVQINLAKFGEAKLSLKRGLAIEKNVSDSSPQKGVVASRKLTNVSSDSTQKVDH